jgi:glyoxylate reductase
MPRIVLTRHIHPQAEQELKMVGDVVVWTEDRPIPPAVLESWIASAEACLCMLTDRIDEHLLDHAPHLRVVANMAVGYDNIDVAAAARRGVVVTNTPDVLTEATAELTWTLMLALMRGVVPARRAMLDGGWKQWSPNGFLGTEVSGKTLGIVGMGRIGQAVARRAPSFNMPVVALKPHRPASQSDVPRLERDAFLAQADVISVHLPLTSGTRALINQSWFDRMKPTAFLINTSRGPIVDEAALLTALDTGRLAGAALDVFAVEPVDRHNPLISHAKVLATPHIGSATHETRRAMALRAVLNVRAVLTGDAPRDWVNRPH